MRLRILLGRFRLKPRNSSPRSAIVDGAGEAAEALIPLLLSAPDSPYMPVASLAAAPTESNRWTVGVPIAGKFSNLRSTADKHDATVPSAAIPSTRSELLQRANQAGSGARRLEEGRSPSPRFWLARSSCGGPTAAGQE